MKKLLKALCLVLCGCILAFACSCGIEDRTYVFVMPDGAPALSVVKLMKDYPEIGGVKIEYKIVPADNIAAEFNSADIAIMPTNASAKLYNKGISLKIAAINVFGNLYMVGTKAVTSFDDLKGEVVYNIGEGKTPDLLLKYFLTESGIEYVKSDEPVEGKVALHYEGEATTVVASLMQGKTKFGVLGEPVVTNAITKLNGANKNASIAFDFQNEWKNITGEEYSFPQAGTVVKTSVSADKTFMNALYSALEENGAFILGSSGEVLQILKDNGSSLNVNFNADVVAACNIGCVKAENLKTSLESYFTKIVAFDKTFVGGKLPDANYYYSFA